MLSRTFSLPQGRMLSFFGILPKGHVLDVPNALLGSLYYTYQLLLGIPVSSLEPLTKMMTMAAFASTVFLAYQLTFVVYELCILCWTTHVINATMLYIVFFSRPKEKDSNKAKTY
jgi:vitamin-K-epoxide reductase (warfarin-sensitive)